MYIWRFHFLGINHVHITGSKVSISVVLSCASVIYVEGKLENRVKSGVCELHMTGVSPFCRIIWIFMSGISYLSYGCGEIILKDSRYSQSKRLPHRVERKVVHYIVYAHICRKPGVEIDHMRHFAIPFRFRKLDIFFFQGYRRFISLLPCDLCFLFFYKFRNRILVQTVKSYLSVEKTVCGGTEHLFTHKCLRREIQHRTIFAILKIGCTVTGGSLLV